MTQLVSPLNKQQTQLMLDNAPGDEKRIDALYRLANSRTIRLIAVDDEAIANLEHALKLVLGSHAFDLMTMALINAVSCNQLDLHDLSDAARDELIAKHRAHSTIQSWLSVVRTMQAEEKVR
jgi:hypothetical protein